MKMRQFIPCFLMTSLISSASFAAQDGVYFKSGAYVGADAGYNYMNAKFKEDLSIPGAGVSGASSEKESDNGFLFDVFAGYRHIFENKFFVGLDATVSWDTNETKKDVKIVPRILQSHTKLKSSYKIIPAVVLGRQFSDRWIGFAKLGVGISRFKASHALTAVATSRRAPTDKFHKTKAGFSGVLGGEYALTKSISALMSASYERYGSVKKSLKIPDVNIRGSQNNIKIRPYYIAAKLGLSYRF